MTADMNSYNSIRSKADVTGNGNTVPQECWFLILSPSLAETERLKQGRQTARFPLLHQIALTYFKR